MKLGSDHSLRTAVATYAASYRNVKVGLGVPIGYSRIIFTSNRAYIVFLKIIVLMQVQVPINTRLASFTVSLGLFCRAQGRFSRITPTFTVLHYYVVSLYVRFFLLFVICIEINC